MSNADAQPKQNEHAVSELTHHHTAANQMNSQAGAEALSCASSQTAIGTCVKGLENGDLNAICELARCCYESRVGAELVQQIVQTSAFKALAAENAKRYARGLAEPVNDEKMCVAFKCVEDQNDPDVLCAIGRTYKFGWGVEKNVAKAVEYYVKAADLGLYEAMVKLKDCKGKNAGTQLKAAFQHFKQQADAGDANARFAGAYCYCHGIGVAENHQAAIRMCQTTANQQNSNITALQGCMHYFGHGVEKNQTKAVELFKQAANAGNTEGLHWLGWCYHDAVGVTRDYKQAAFWYEKAAAQGHASAAWSLGLCYANGFGVKENMLKAFQYYKQAAIAGSDWGQLLTGECYQCGKGVKQSYEQAVYWFEKAFAQGFTCVTRDLAYCLEQLRKARGSSASVLQTETTQQVCASQQHEIGFLFAKFAAELGCGKSYFCLGDCYFNGIGTARDIAAAAKCYKRAKPSDSQKYLNLAKCLETGEVYGKNEIDFMSVLKQASTALRQEINTFLSQMQ